MEHCRTQTSGCRPHDRGHPEAGITERYCMPRPATRRWETARCNVQESRLQVCVALQSQVPPEQVQSLASSKRLKNMMPAKFLLLGPWNNLPVKQLKVQVPLVGSKLPQTGTSDKESTKKATGKGSPDRTVPCLTGDDVVATCRHPRRAALLRQAVDCQLAGQPSGGASHGSCPQ
jgi:hypothetical protein